MSRNNSLAWGSQAEQPIRYSRTGDEAVETSPLSLATSEVAPRIWAIQINGSLDASTLSNLRTLIVDLFAKNIYRIVIELEKVKYIASSAFSCFIASHDIARCNGGEMVFSVPSPDVREAFHLLGLSQILRLTCDAKSAIASFSQPSAV